MRACRARRATCSGSLSPRVFLPSESSTRAAGRRWEPPGSSGTRTWAASRPSASPSPIAVAPEIRRRSTAATTSARSVVGATCCSAVEPKETSPSRKAAGRSPVKRARRALGGGDPVGLDVGGLHRARGVGDHHHDALALLGGHGALGLRERDDERGERQQHERGGQVASPRARGDRREHVEVRVADRVAATPALGAHVGEQGQGDEHQPGQQERRRGSSIGLAGQALRRAASASSMRGIGHPLEHVVEHPVGVDAGGQRLVGEHDPVAQHVAGEVAHVDGQHVVAAAQQRERPAGVDEVDRPARARAELDPALRRPGRAWRP